MPPMAAATGPGARRRHLGEHDGCFDCFCKGEISYAMEMGKKPTKPVFTVYILKCSDGTLYTGWTDDLEKRLAAHNAGKGAKYTRGRGPVELVYQESFSSKSEAMKREYAVKKLPRDEKMKLIDHNKK